MANVNVSENHQSDLVAEKALLQGLSVYRMFGQFAVTFSPEHIEQLRIETGKLKPGVLAMCGTLDEVDNFLNSAAGQTKITDA